MEANTANSFGTCSVDKDKTEIVIDPLGIQIAIFEGT